MNSVITSTKLDFNYDGVQIVPAQNFHHVYSASRLVYDQYYAANLCDFHSSRLRFLLRDLLPDSTTFVALYNEEVIATVTGIRWGPTKLPADSVFPEELKALARLNIVISEGTKFASKAHEFNFPQRKGRLSLISEELLKTLLYWSSVVGARQWINVIHPKQAKYFVEDLGFEILSDVKSCKHVEEAPGILISMDVKNSLTRTELIPHYLRDRYVTIVPSLKVFQHHYSLRQDELFFLLLQYPSFFRSCSAEEIALAQFYYPDVFPAVRNVATTLEQATSSGQPILSAAAKILYDLDIQPSVLSDNEHADLNGYLMVFEHLLKLYARRFFHQLTIEAGSALPKVPLKNLNMITRELIGPIKALVNTLETPESLQFNIRPICEHSSKLVLQIDWSTSVACPDMFEAVLKYTGGKSALNFIHDKNFMYSYTIEVECYREELKLISGVDGTRKQGKKSILIVEPNEIDSIVLQKVLEKEGYNTEIANDGVTALSLLGLNSYDLAIFNSILPDMEGRAFLQQLRKLGLSKRQLALIVCTAFVVPGNKQEWLKMGVQGYLEKPIRINELYDLIEGSVYLDSNKQHLQEAA